MNHPTRIFLAALTCAALAPGCSSDDTEPLDQCFEPTVSLDVCDPSGTFTIDSTNDWFPLVVGNHTVLEGSEDGELVRVEIKVLDETEVVAGVTTRVVEASEFVDDELYEVARDFYAVAADGTVCYFGEDVDFYENGVVANHDGTWRAGVDDALPGIIMPGTPAAGQSFFQEQAPDARDMARVVETGLTRTLGGQSYDDVVRMLDSNPLDGAEGCDEEEEKLYAPGVGLAQDTVKIMLSFTPGNTN